jgi:hypothetical protein
VQVKVLMPVHVVERQAGLGKTFELGCNLLGSLTSSSRMEKCP